MHTSVKTQTRPRLTISHYLNYPLAKASTESRTMRCAPETLEQFDDLCAELDRRQRKGEAASGEPHKKEDAADICLRLGMEQLRAYLDLPTVD